MRLFPKAMVAALTTSAALTTVMVAGAAPASAATDSFRVYNFSSYPIRFDDSNGDFSGGKPAYGSILYPGASYHDFELTYTFSGIQDTGTVHYSILDNGKKIGEFWPHMSIGSFRTDWVYCTMGSGPGQCLPPWRNVVNYWVSGNTQTYLDPPGTVHNIPPQQGQAQADALKQLCAAHNAAKCTFTPTTRQEFEAPAHQVGKALGNPTDEEQDTDLGVEDKVGSTDSVGVEITAEAEILDAVKVAVTAKYDHEWSQEHTFSQIVHVHCPPHHRCWVTATEPMFRDTGTFTIHLGNTTWNLPGVYFDSPNPNGNGEFEVEEEPMSGTERVSLVPVTQQKVLQGSYTVPRGSRIVKPRLYLAIAGPRRVPAGEIAGYRITLSRSQPRNALSFAPKNVRVWATVAGRRVNHWLLRTLPRGDVRDLWLAVKTPSTPSLCVTVTAAANNARGATSRYCATVASGRPDGLG